MQVRWRVWAASLSLPTLLDVYIQYAYHSLMDVIWDPAKARSNLNKHGVSFADVEPVFYDPFAIRFEDMVRRMRTAMLLLVRTR